MNTLYIYASKVLLDLVFRVSQIRWPSLKTTFPLFDERPTNRAAAVKAGWKLLDACNGQWLGER